MLHVSRAQLRAASQEFSAAEQMQSSMSGEHALSGQVTGWTLATKARLGMLDEARASLAALSAQRAPSCEVCNAAAVIHLAAANPPAALLSVSDVLVVHASAIHALTPLQPKLL